MLRARIRGRKPRSCKTCEALGIDGGGHTNKTHDRMMRRARGWQP